MTVKHCECCSRRKQIDRAAVADALEMARTLLETDLLPGTAIIAIRRSLRMSQAEFANAIGVGNWRLETRERCRKQHALIEMLRSAIRLAKENL